MKLMTVAAFMRSYDRDMLELQDDPAWYIVQCEAELQRLFPMAQGFDSYGNKVWSLDALRQWSGVTSEEPIWSEEQLLAAI